MNMEMWAAFTAASIVILVVPGPTIILVINRAAVLGRRSVLPLAAGVVMGDFTAMTFSLLGLGALMSASAALFSVLKWAGAFYLVWLGIKQWREGACSADSDCDEEKVSSRSLLGNSFLVTALNPKSIAFFVAFFPQFVDPLRPVFQQTFLLGSTFLVLAFVNAALYAFFAGSFSEHIKKSGVRRWFNRLGGTALTGAGIFTAGLQRSS